MSMASLVQYRLCMTLLAASLVFVGVVEVADAGLRGRGEARASINRAPGASAQRANRPNNVVRNNPRAAQLNPGNRINAGNATRSGNRANINKGHNTVNVDNHRDVDIDVDGYGRYGYDDHYHPIATAAAVTATVAVTSAVVGSILRPAQMPASCVQVIRYDVTYMQCGSTWYQPQYQGSNITYVVVNAP